MQMSILPKIPQMPSTTGMEEESRETEENMAYDSQG